VWLFTEALSNSEEVLKSDSIRSTEETLLVLGDEKLTPNGGVTRRAEFCGNCFGGVINLIGGGLISLGGVGRGGGVTNGKE